MEYKIPPLENSVKFNLSFSSSKFKLNNFQFVNLKLISCRYYCLPIEQVKLDFELSILHSN